MSGENNKNNKNSKKIIIISLLAILLLSVIGFLYIQVKNDEVTVKESKREEVKSSDRIENDIKIEKVEEKTNLTDEVKVYNLSYENDESVLNTMNNFLTSTNVKVGIKEFTSNNNFKLIANLETNTDIKDVRVKVYDITKAYKEPQTIIQNTITYETYTDETVDIDNLDEKSISFIPTNIFVDEIKEKVFREEVVLNLESEDGNKKVFSKTYKNDFKHFIGVGHERIGTNGDNSPIYSKGEFVYYGQVYELYVNGEKVELNVYESEKANIKKFNTKNEIVNSFALINKITEIIPNGNADSHDLMRSIVY